MIKKHSYAQLVQAFKAAKSSHARHNIKKEAMARQGFNEEHFPRYFQKSPLDALAANRWLLRGWTLEQIAASKPFNCTRQNVHRLLIRHFRRSPIQYAERRIIRTCRGCGIEDVIVKKRWRLDKNCVRGSDKHVTFLCPLCKTMYKCSKCGAFFHPTIRKKHRFMYICQDCNNKRSREWWHAHPKAAAKISKRWRKKMESKGLCIICGIRPATRGKTCKECYAKNEKRTRMSLKKRLQRREEEGRCLRCGMPRDSIYKHCAICRKNAGRNT